MLPDLFCEKAALDLKLHQGIHSLFFLAKALLSKINLPSFNLCTVFKDSESSPQHAALGAFFRTLENEDTRCRFKLLEMGTSESRDPLDLVLAELQSSGPIHLRFDGKTRLGCRLEPAQPSPDATLGVSVQKGAAYLITGGAGGLGKHLALYLATHFKARMVLLGRSPSGSGISAFLEKIKSLGGEGMYLQADVSHGEQIRSAVAESVSRFGPLRGVFHVAGTTRDSLFYNKDFKDLKAVLTPKIQGTLVLDRATAQQPLDFMVLFSSFAAIVGNAGQSDYALANGFLDFFAQARNARRDSGAAKGLCVSVNWPYWQDGGMTLSEEQIAAMREKLGLIPLETETGFQALFQGMSAGWTDLAPLVGEVSLIQKSLRDLAGVSVSAVNSEPLPSRALPTRRDDGLAEWLAQTAAELLKTPVEEFQKDRALEEYGLDSFMNMRLLKTLEKRFGSLPKSLLFEHNSLEALGAYFQNQLDPVGQAQPAARTVASSRANQAPAGAAVAVAPPAVALSGSTLATANVENQTRQWLTRIFADALKTNPQELTPDASLADAGLDSFLSLRLLKILEKHFGSLPKSLLFQCETVAALTVWFLDHKRTVLEDRFAVQKAVLPTLEQGEPFPVEKNKPLVTPLVLTPEDLSARPDLQQVVDGLLERYGWEATALARADIAPTIFLGAQQTGLFYFNRSETLLFAFCYVGPPESVSVLAESFVTYGNSLGLQANILETVGLNHAGSIPMSANPFGLLQRVVALPAFKLTGKPMRRLRYQVGKFEKQGRCETVEYTSGGDSATDCEIGGVIDAWCKTKTMVNPYIWNVKDAMVSGSLDARHRVFLTRLDGVLQNVIVITAMPGDQGYLMDLEFYPAEMPLGGLEFGICRIIEKLKTEGVTCFSLGATFGVPSDNETHADPRVTAVLAELRSQGVFTGEGNCQFKNKFRPQNQTLYLSRPRDADPGTVTDVILMIANPAGIEKKTKPTNPPSGVSGKAAGEVAVERKPAAKPPTEPKPKAIKKRKTPPEERKARLDASGWNPMNIPADLIEMDLVTDSWAQLATGPVVKRVTQLQSHVANAPDLAGKLKEIFPFRHIIPVGSGRMAESLLAEAWPVREGKVIQNLLFPTWIANQFHSGFEPVCLPHAQALNLTSPELFRGGLDEKRLRGFLQAEGERVPFVCLELGNNATGGLPVSMAQLDRLKKLLDGIPLILDATRILENAQFIIEREPQWQGKDLFAVVAAICGRADGLTASLAKDFGVHGGGLVAVNDPQIAQSIQAMVGARGSGLNVMEKHLIATGLADRDFIVQAVLHRMVSVSRLHSALTAAGAPLVQPAGGHCLLWMVPAPEGSAFPLHSFLADLYLQTGIRGGTHNAGLLTDSPLNALVRLAFPLGLDEPTLDQIQDRLSRFVAEYSPSTNLELVEKPAGFGGEVYGRFRRVPVVAPVPEPTRHRLSEGQKGLWFIQQMDPQSHAYNVPAAALIRQKVDEQALEQALHQISQRHGALRTTFAAVDGKPLATVHPHLKTPFRVINLTAGQWAHRDDLVMAKAREPFDLAAGPPWCAFLFRYRDDAQVLLLLFHHIVMDGASMGVLLKDFNHAYAGVVSGDTDVLDPAVGTYGDFAAWQQQWLASEDATRHWNYWLAKMGGDPAPLDLPTDYPRPKLKTYAGALHVQDIHEDLYVRIRKLARSEGGSPFMVLVAAFKLLLGRYSGQTDVVTGVPFSGRPEGRFEQLLGYCVNMIPLRMDLTPNRHSGGFRGFLSDLRETLLEAFEHPFLPLPSLVERLAPSHDESRSPLFQVCFVMQDWMRALEREEGALNLLGGTLLPEVQQAGEFDLTVEVLDAGARKQVFFKYNPDLFSESRIAAMAQHYLNLLASVCADPGRETGHLDLLSEAEKSALVSDGGVAENQTLPGFLNGFLEQVQKTPETAALQWQNQVFNYRELYQNAAPLARELSHLGVGPGVVVGICISRSPQMALAVVATLLAGGAYLPLDPHYPAERITYMVGDGRPAVVLTQKRWSQTFEGHLESDRVLCLDRGFTNDDAVLEIDPGFRNRAASDPAYVIYTSGSTGKPKGVVMPSGPLDNLISWQLAQPGFAPAARCLQFASLSFDVAFQELFSTWCSGGTLVIIGEDTRRDPRALARFLGEHQVQRLFLPFIALQQLTAAIADDGALPTALREVITAGEQLQASRGVRAAFQRMPHCRLVNQYGPSESHVVSAFELGPDPASWSPLPPIGRAVAQTRLHILDFHLRPVPAGVAGELYIGGDCLAQGYGSRPRLTATRFVPDPFGEGRLYRTGDKVRFTLNGDGGLGPIEFLGRVDHQVKVRGYRVEMGEIETALLDHPEVHEAAVLLVGDMPKRLVAFIQAASGKGSEITAELRRFLLDRLPDYMVPEGFALLETLPLTPSGKINRLALQRQAAAGEVSLSAGAGKSQKRPTNPAEQLLAEIWSEVLGFNRQRETKLIGKDHHFFELGGHSLLATQVISRIRQVFAVELPLRSLFENPILGDLASVIGQTENQPELPPLEPGEYGGDAPLSPAQHRLWFIDQLTPGNAAYNIPIAIKLEGMLDADALAEALNAVVCRHDILRSRIEKRGEEPRQWVRPELLLETPTIDLSGLNEHQIDGAILVLARREARKPFRLDEDPLLRSCLLRRSDTDHGLLVTFHHIVSDGWSIEIFMSDLNRAYGDLMRGRCPETTPRPIQFAHVARWQNQCLEEPALTEQLEWWQQHLQGTPALELPTDRVRPGVQSFRGALQVFSLDETTGSAVTSMCREEQVTPFMVLLAAYQTLLHRYSGQDDFAVGSPIAGRRHREVEDVIGFFVNNLVLRADFSQEDSFITLLKKLRETTLQAYSRQDVPFEKLVDALQLDRNLDRNPLFQVMFVLQNTPHGGCVLPGVTPSLIEVDRGLTHFDLTLALEEKQGGYFGYMEYNPDLFDAASISKLIQHYRLLLKTALAEPEAALDSLDFTSKEERIQLLQTWNPKELPVSEAPVHSSFERNAREIPDAVAGSGWQPAPFLCSLE